MTFDFKELKEKVQSTEKWLSEEYFSVRTGRATPALLDGVRVESYGAKVPLNQVASISMEDARTLRLVPYDISQIKEIENAISTANLGVSAGADEKGIRVSFPELTSESRQQLLKVVGDKLENARIALRQVRDDVWEDIQEKEKAKEISEDDKFDAKEAMQKIVDEGNNTLEAVAQKKEREILT